MKKISRKEMKTLLGGKKINLEGLNGGGEGCACVTASCVSSTNKAGDSYCSGSCCP